MQSQILKTGLSLILAVVFCNAADASEQNIGILRGTVKLKDKPFAGVLVIVRSTEAGQKTALSSSTGEYEIRNLTNGTYLLTVANTPYVLSEGLGGSFIQQEISGSGTTTVDIVLKEGGVLTGCAQYPSQQPVIEREIIYENTDLSLSGFSLMSLRRTATTNDQGCFRLFGLPGGRYRVGVGRPVNNLSTELSAPFSPVYYPGVKRQTDAQLVEVIAGQEHDLGTLVVKNDPPTAVVKGQFIDSATGERVPNLSFELVRQDERGIGSISSLRADETGEFRIENQTAGHYNIQPAVGADKSYSFTFKSISFELSETGASDLVIRATALTATITGEVRINNSDSASNKDCSIALKEGDGLSASGGGIHRITLNRGKFDLSGLPRGIYTLVVMPLRTSLQYEQAQVGPQLLRGSAGPVGLVRIDLAAGDQSVKIFLSENTDTRP